MLAVTPRRQKISLFKPIQLALPTAQTKQCEKTNHGPTDNIQSPSGKVHKQHNRPIINKTVPETTTALTQILTHTKIQWIIT
jgi:hypothetical protein